MNRLLVSSLITALSIGSCIGFANHVQSFRGGAKLTRMEWVQDSIGHAYFWEGVAKQSMVPVLGVFIACVFVGRLNGQVGVA